MRRIEITVPAALDIDDLLRVSQRSFGTDAAIRYEELIAIGLEALAADPERRA